MSEMAEEWPHGATPMPPIAKFASVGDDQVASGVLHAAVAIGAAV